MGNARSTNSDQEEDLWWTNPTRNVQKTVAKLSLTTEEKGVQKNFSRTDEDQDFQLKLAAIREKRIQIIGKKHKEMEDLRKENEMLRQENENLKLSQCNKDTDETNERLRKENESLKDQIQILEHQIIEYGSVIETNRELRVNITEIQSEIQNLNSEISVFEQERQDYREHVAALKDVIKVSKQMLLMREDQLKELKQKVDDIEATISTQELSVCSIKLKAEYESQLENIKNLRVYYEQRQKADHKEKEELRDIIEDKDRDLATERKKNIELQENVDRLEEDNSKKYYEIKSLESNLGLSKAESRQYQAELTVINQLFSQILMGFNNSQEIDIDKLIKQLESNHDLLQNIANNELSSASSALPKVFLDLVNDIDCKKSDNNGRLETILEESDTQSLHQFNSIAEIVENLPKVWRVLIELLSHQSPPANTLTDDNVVEANPCYKLIETPKGPSSVLSVSQTFIRLKDLILEKKCLEKETQHLKQLNTHLETRLQDQESRLELVTNELSKTWHIVGKLQKQHQMLHTQEKILRYELAQKRKLLLELKEELEYSREKWQQARQKNTDTEHQWRQLRTEFASRKTEINDDSNNSIESGYSDERECGSSSDDEAGYETQMSDCSKLERNTNESPIVGADQSEISNIEEGMTDTPTKDCVEVAHSIIELQKTNELIETNDEKTKEHQASSTSSSAKAFDAMILAREERLKRLEGLTLNLVEQVSNTSNKSSAISNKLDNLHEVYRERNENDNSSKS